MTLSYSIVFFWLTISISFGWPQNQSSIELQKVSQIGFASYTIVDYSRPSNISKKLGRSMQLNVWYPGQSKSSTDEVSLTDFLKLKHDVHNFKKSSFDLKSAIEDYSKWAIAEGANSSLLDSLLTSDIRIKARRNLDFSTSKFPVLLMMHGSATDFAFMAESFVEEGYVVVNVPFQGYTKTDLDVNAMGVETQIRDYEFAMAWLSSNINTDLTDITAIGFSFGGQSALGLACRNTNVKKVISYDGGIGTKFGARMVKENAFCTPENISVDILHIYDASYGGNYLDMIKSLIYSNRTMVGLDQIAHWHFTSLGYFASLNPELFPNNKYSKKGYQTIVQITKAYLNNHSSLLGSSFDARKKYELISRYEHLKAIKK